MSLTGFGRAFLSSLTAEFRINPARVIFEKKSHAIPGQGQYW
jgi:hypothetical protein